MDTQKKYGLAKWKAILLLVQLVLVTLATIGTAFIFGFSISQKLGALSIISYCTVLLSYIALIFYGVYGHNKDNSYYLGAVYAFCAAILLNTLLPFRNAYQIATLVLLFGAFIAFAQHLKNTKVANYLLLTMCVLALAFTIYSTITAKTETLGQASNNFFAVFAMYISSWTPVIMTVTLALSYNVRTNKK